MKRTTTTKTYVAKANGRRESVTKREASTLSHMNVNVPSVYIQSSACCKT